MYHVKFKEVASVQMARAMFRTLNRQPRFLTLARVKFSRPRDLHERHCHALLRFSDRKTGREYK